MDTRNLPYCILINGPSSAGKTGLARKLQGQLPVVFLYFGIDAVLYSLPPQDLDAMMVGRRIDRAEYSYQNLEQGFYNAVAGLLAAGNRLIVDNALISKAQRAQFERATAGYKVLRVGVSCDLKGLEHRELQRGDRAIGTARYEADKVHVGLKYDLMIDTTNGDIQTGIDDILGYILEG